VASPGRAADLAAQSGVARAGRVQEGGALLRCGQFEGLVEDLPDAGGSLAQGGASGLAAQVQQGGLGGQVHGGRAHHGIVGQPLEGLLAVRALLDVPFEEGTLGLGKALGQKAPQLVFRRTGAYVHFSDRL
jgi:hypothetical protein